MKGSRPAFGCIGLMLFMAYSPCVAQYVCGPEWLENLPGADGAIWAMTTWDPDGAGPEPELLVVGGTFSTIGGVPARNLAAFDGTSWSGLGGGIDDLPLALAVYQGDLIVGGRFTTAGNTPASNVARWDGSNWSPLGAGPSMIYALAVYQDDLYAAGTFVDVEGTQGIARWDGLNWTQVGGGTGVYHCPASWCGTAAFALAVYHDELVVAGSFTQVGSIPAHNIARWNGTQWNQLWGGADDQVDTLAVYNDRLIAGGWFRHAGTIYSDAQYIAAWDGYFWSPLGDGMNNPVYALTTNNGHLFAGGWFSTAGGTPAGNIAAWDGTAWSAMAGGVDSLVRKLTVFEGDVVAAGDFVTAGGEPSLRWARWRDPPPPQITLQPASQGVLVGQDACLSVAGSGVTPLQYQWRKSGSPLLDDGRISGTNTPELTIASAQKTDAGWYDVVVTDCKSTTSSAAYLSVTCPLTVSSPPAPQAVIVWESATFSVGVTGETGTPQFSWRRNNVALQDDGVHIFGSATATLLISPARIADAGSYNVVVTDDCGSVTSPAAALTVTCPAMVTPDCDRDCDVDSADLAAVMSCLAGSGAWPADGCPPWPNNRKRAIADFDWDGDVDQTDFGIFQRCVSGENSLPDAGCAQ